MYRYLLACILSISALNAAELSETESIAIWHEEFGDASNPALLLMMGGCCQGTMWHDSFCEDLAEEGFYVIRYDHRDAGESSCFDFEEQPYTLSDMAQDAADLLDILAIPEAHVAGLSMGAAVAQLLSVEHPGRVLSLTLISTSGDFEPLCRSLEGRPVDPAGLPGASAAYLAIMEDFLHRQPETQEEQLELRLEAWRELSGSGHAFEEDMQRELHQRFLERCAHPESVPNHIAAQTRSLEAIRSVPSQVSVPTVVVHGTDDCIFPLAHGHDLAWKIKGAELTIVEGMGHVPHRAYDELYIEAIKRASKVDLQRASTASEWLDAVELRLNAFDRDRAHLNILEAGMRFITLTKDFTGDAPQFQFSVDEMIRFQKSVQRIARISDEIVQPLNKATNSLKKLMDIEV